MKTSRFLILASLLLLNLPLFGQLPGLIFKSASPAVNPMDPNGDGLICISILGFSQRDDGPQSEIPYWPLPNLFGEPHGDLSSGSTCGNTELVSVQGIPGLSNGRTIYSFYDNVNGIPDDGDDRMFFRIRCASPWLTGNFGFSILLDTDNALGFSGPHADPNAVAGNPGFEIEIRVRTGGGSKIIIDNVDGTTNGTEILNYPISSHYQESFALLNDQACLPNTPVFHDFYVVLSDLGLTSTSEIHIFSATSQSGLSVLSGSGADWYGIDDQLFSSEDLLVSALFEKFSSTPIGELGLNGKGWLNLVGLDLTGEFSEDRVELQWKDCTENQVLEYFVEKSMDGHQFETIGKKVPTGSDSDPILLYDYDYAQGDNFYRLVAITANGGEYHSPSINVKINPSENSPVTFYPNPSNGILRVKYPAEATHPQLNIYAHDRLIKSPLLPADGSGEGMIDLDVGAGIYLARFYVNGKWYSEKILVNH
ncbi:MAG: T9SS type A sorting domain-containing protein [Bacteroidia bacterium]|nr:T9SS type A sorting domain-containing protein [Bacteroidia bacterium]